MKKLVLMFLIFIGLIGATNALLPGPNNGQITVQNSSTIVTPVVFPSRYDISFLNPSATITIYICKANTMTAGQPSATLKTCSSSVADIILAPGASYSEPINGYAGQYTAITSSSTATLVITES
jgi:hypothetical protein